MKHSVFVITPFGDDYIALFNELKEYFKEEYDFINAGDMDNQQNILKDIVVGISSADIIVADLTGNNPNVFYELGLAHAMNKKVIIITQAIDELPFDIKSYRAFQYSMMFYKIPELKEELKKNLDGAIDGTVGYGNPVYDFLPNYNPKQSSINNENNSDIESNDGNPKEPEYDDSDAGILDFIETIQTSSNDMLSEINTMGEEMNEMSASVSEASLEINRVKAQSGNVDLPFVRKVCRRLGQPIDAFSNKLNGHVDVILDKWSSIENSYLLMLDNQLVTLPANKKGMQESVCSLKEMQASISNSDRQIESFMGEVRQVLGYERTLTKAVNALILSLERYMQATGQMSSSIDRIVSKSSIVLGNI